MSDRNFLLFTLTSSYEKYVPLFRFVFFYCCPPYHLFLYIYLCLSVLCLLLSHIFSVTFRNGFVLSPSSLCKYCLRVVFALLYSVFGRNFSVGYLSLLHLLSCLQVWIPYLSTSAFACFYLCKTHRIVSVDNVLCKQT